MKLLRLSKEPITPLLYSIIDKLNGIFLFMICTLNVVFTRKTIDKIEFFKDFGNFNLNVYVKSKISQTKIPWRNGALFEKIGFPQKSKKNKKGQLSKIRKHHA